MVYDWDGRRTRRLQMLRLLGALAIPALLFGSAIAAVEWIDRGAPDVRANRVR
ncbi:hypothetical protein EPK84_10565 (plasmid) [Sinorhizobium fredii]|nr:hypothetical protein [Sinorhizobium fredii]UTY47201.1 hypothetical protein EPK84_10565 [Sinorhizobium fredii]